MTNQLPKLAFDGVLCDRPQPGCVVGGKRNYARDSIIKPRSTKMNKTLSADQLSRYVRMRIRNPAAADRYWARCHGRNIAADAAIDDEAAAQIKEFLKTRLSAGDHAQVCDMLEAAGGDPDAEAQDDLPRAAADVKIGFDQCYPGLRHISRHSPDSCRVIRQFAPFPRFRQSCAVGASCRWGWNEPAPCRALKIAEFSVIEAHLFREFGSDA